MVNLTNNEVREIIEKYQNRSYDLKRWAKEQLDKAEEEDRKKYYQKLYSIFLGEYNLLQDILREIELSIKLKQIK